MGGGPSRGRWGTCTAQGRVPPVNSSPGWSVTLMTTDPYLVQETAVRCGVPDTKRNPSGGLSGRTHQQKGSTGEVRWCDVEVDRCMWNHGFIDAVIC